MNEIRLIPTTDFGYAFVTGEFLPAQKNEYWLRDSQTTMPKNGWRHLNARELETLVKNGNTCQDWDDFYVSDPFNPDAIYNSSFVGLIRIGALEKVALEHHDLVMPAGITNSKLIACDVGDNCAIHDCAYISHYIIGNNCILSNNHEIHVSNHAKFGNGIVLDGEKEDVRIWIDVMNEAGGRSILPFEGIVSADAYIWATRRDDLELMKRLKAMTDERFENHRGLYGQIGDSCIIRSNRVIKDVKIGDSCYIKGANKLKNLTINSSSAERSQIGEGVELVNGIIGYGSRVFYGCKAVRFIMGNNTNLKYGARLIHSVLGDNSTVSCCELLNNLIFPAHEQHHNNSFLIAALVAGQSNIAAGATLGSNHNSRTNDGELVAGRGFWPGLCVSVKHFSRFASFVMLAKADYQYELDIRLPFSLVSENTSENRLEVMGAYWWMYNMYALMRSEPKIKGRDKRISKVQNIEEDPFAPDTIEEIFTALTLLEKWTGESLGAFGSSEAIELGKERLSHPIPGIEEPIVTATGMENSSRETRILKPIKSYHAYRDMIRFYALKNLLAFLEAKPSVKVSDMNQVFKRKRERVWENVGGQIMKGESLELLIAKIKFQTLKTWEDVHAFYATEQRLYKEYVWEHAYNSLLDLDEKESIDEEYLLTQLKQFEELVKFTAREVYKSRKKDYENPFRQMTSRNDAVVKAVFGSAEENPFVKKSADDAALLCLRINAQKERFRAQVKTSQPEKKK